MICGRKTFPKFITHLPEPYYIFLWSWRDSESSQKKKKKKQARKKGNRHNQQLANRMSANYKSSRLTLYEDILVVKYTTSFPGIPIH